MAVSSKGRMSDRRMLEVLGNMLLSEGSYVDGTANALVAIESFEGLLCGRIDLCGFGVRSRSIKHLRKSKLCCEILGITVSQRTAKSSSTKSWACFISSAARFR